MKTLTLEQHKEYSMRLEEIQTVKRFLECGGGCIYNQFSHRFPFSLIVKVRHKRKVFLHRNWHACGREENEFEIPTDLQMKLIKTMEQWIGEKEQELLDI